MNQVDPGYSGHDDPRLQPREVDDPAGLMEGCDHSEACVRALGVLWYGGEVDRDSAYWMDDAARRLGCAACRVREWC